MGKLKFSEGKPGYLENDQNPPSLAIQTRKDPMSACLSIHRTQSDLEISRTVDHIDGLFSLDNSDDQEGDFPRTFPRGLVSLVPGWVNGIPVFKVTGNPEQISSMIALPILEIRPNRYLCQSGAMLTLELAFREEQQQPARSWKIDIDPTNPRHSSFLL